MNKITLFLLLALGLSFQAMAQNQRRVLVEEFTQASCGPCAAANPAFNAALTANEAKVTPLKYQVWWPGFDPMYLHNTPDVDNRVAYYGVSGVPDGYENGVTSFYPGSYSASSIDAAYNTLTPVAITIDHSFSANYEEITVNVSVTSAEAISGDLRLRVAVAEEQIIFATAPGSNGEKEFFDVMKKMLPDADGTETGAFAAGETKSYSFSWKLKNCYNLNEIEAIAWLQNDDTKEVWQSEKSAPNVVIPGGNFAAITLTASTANVLTCNNSIEPTFILKNVGASALTDASISYSVDGGASQSYSWSGSLNTNQTSSVTLPAITFTEPGSHALDLFVSSTNNGVQTNQVAASGAINVIAQYEATAPPIAEGFEGADFPAAGWGLANAAAGGWNLSGAASGYGASSQAVYCDFYNLANGTKAYFYLPKVDLLASNGPSKLLFDHAHTYYNATYINDRLQIDISTDCGATWNTPWDKIGAALATAPAQTAVFVPNAGQWVTDSIDLSGYNGSEVLVRFQATSGYGNFLWVDNVNVSTVVSGTVSQLPLSMLQVQPNPSSVDAELRFTLEQSEDINLQVYNSLGVLVAQQNLGVLSAGQQSTRLDAYNLPNGNYRIVLQGKNGIAQLPWAIVK